MPSRNIRKAAREYFLSGDYLNGLRDRENIVEMESGMLSYGRCNLIDYPSFGKLIANLICYTNKQYFAYKAIDNSSKVEYLSRKQYVKYSVLVKKSTEKAKEYLKNNGRMTTMFKLLKRAIEENPRAHWLKSLKLGESELEELSRVLQKDAEIEFVQVPVQTAYDLRIAANNIGSGKRFCTHSCMQGDPTGVFYEHFDCKAYIAKKQGKAVGRFLVWNTENDKTYVDRLYCIGGEQDDILFAIDKKWKDALKYPLDTGTQFFVKALKPVNDFNDYMFYPYLDTFYHLINRNGELVLSNYSVKGLDSIECHSASGNPDKKFIKCEKCGKLVVQGRYYRAVTRHYMECEREYDSEQQREVYLGLYNAFAS